jgi:hypothetical protein
MRYVFPVKNGSLSTAQIPLQVAAQFLRLMTLAAALFWAGKFYTAQLLSWQTCRRALTLALTLLLLALRILSFCRSPLLRPQLWLWQAGWILRQRVKRGRLALAC